MLLRDLFEARKNPEQNPKTSINSIINNALSETKDSIAGTPNLFVSFTELEKLGINPSSEYDTPIGIYAYPADYVTEIMGKNKRAINLPFAGQQPYVNLFKVRGKIVNITTMTMDQVHRYYEQIFKYLSKIGLGNDDVFHDVNREIERAPQNAMRPSYPGGQFWYVTMETAAIMSNEGKGSQASAWNALMRGIGIQGVVDIDGVDGAGIIHENEPCQAVFFSTDVITDVERHRNAFSPEHMQKRVQRGSIQHASVSDIYKRLNAISDPEEMYELLSQNWELFRYVRNKQIRKYILDKDPKTIANLINATPDDQLIALRKRFRLIKMIRKPDQAVVARVFEEDPTEDKVQLILSTINYPNEVLQKVIVSHYPKLLLDFDVPYRSAVKAAIDYWPTPNKPAWLLDLATTFGIKVSPT